MGLRNFEHLLPKIAPPETELRFMVSMSDPVRNLDSKMPGMTDWQAIQRATRAWVMQLLGAECRVIFLSYKLTGPGCDRECQCEIAYEVHIPNLAITSKEAMDVLEKDACSCHTLKTLLGDPFAGYRHSL